MRLVAIMTSLEGMSLLNCTRLLIQIIVQVLTVRFSIRVLYNFMQF